MFLFGARRSNPLIPDLHAHGLFEHQHQKWLQLKKAFLNPESVTACASNQSGVQYAGYNLPETLCLWDESAGPHLAGNMPYDQGDTSECVSYSVCTMIEYHLFRNNGNKQYELSKEYLYNWRSNYPDEGMEARDAIDMMLQYGVLLNSDYRKLESVQERIWRKTRKLANGSELSDQEYVELNDDYDQVNSKTIVLSKSNQRVNVQESNHIRARLNSVLDMKRALFYNGPCPIIVPVKDTDHSKGWIWEVEYSHRFRKQDDGLGHCMTIIGYDDQKEAFLLRNSWGPTWGPNRNGHVWMPYEHINEQKCWEAWTLFIDGVNGIGKRKICI